MSTDYRKVVEELNKMYARPWWHWDRWVLRWWNISVPIGIRLKKFFSNSPLV